MTNNKSGKLLASAALMIVVVIAGWFYWYELRPAHKVSPDTDGPYSCFAKDISFDELRGIAKDAGLDISNESLRNFKRTVPTCEEVCSEQKEYARQYDDWFADDDLRHICAGVGIPLPD